MKKGFIVLIITLFISIISGHAERIPEDKAYEVALSFVGTNQAAEKQPLDNIILTRLPVQDLNHYVFDINGIGFIIISSDDHMPPVLAYSLESVYPADGSNLNFNSYILTFNEQLEYCIANSNGQDSEFAHLWNKLSGTEKSPAEDTVIIVGPLMNILWNQDYPYNAYCPKHNGGPGNRVYAGCVATAYSMVMYYYRYPQWGEFQHSYELPVYGVLSADYKNTNYRWNEMKNRINSNDGNSISAVAELQYHAGVGVDMYYSPTGSGAQTFEAKESLRHYFRYSNSAQYLQKSNYLPEQWVPLLKDEIDAKRPMVYSGSGAAGGHAFVLDGYRQTNTGIMFHFNFGWGGSANGYYNYIDPQGFGNGQAIIKNIIPEANYPEYCTDHILTGASGSFTDGSGPIETYKPGSNCSWHIKPADSISKMIFSFVSLRLDSSDTLYVYEGVGQNGQLLGKFTGLENPPDIEVNGNNAFFILKSDATNENEGFEIEYSSEHVQYCFDKLLSSSSGVFDDGSSTSRYNHNINCQWIIKPENAVNLGLNFTEMDLGNEDRLYIYESEDNSLPVGQLTGDSIPPVLISSTGMFRVLLISNDYDNGNGFKADYSTAYGTHEQESINTFVVSPNPANEQFRIIFNNEVNDVISYDLVSIEGKIMSQGNFQINETEHIINTRSIPEGIYILRLKSKNITTKKSVIISH